MPVVSIAGLSRYTAFTIDSGCPPAFTLVFGPDDWLVLPYGLLYAAGWFKGEKGHEIFLKHRLCTFFIQGEILKPLLASFECLEVKRVHVFDPDRHAPAPSGATVVTRLYDNYDDA